jgi:hypothetical protein
MVLRLLERPRINLKTFDSLAKKASNGEDIFHWVASLSKKVKLPIKLKQAVQLQQETDGRGRRRLA